MAKASSKSVSRPRSKPAEAKTSGKKAPAAVRKAFPKGLPSRRLPKQSRYKAQGESRAVRRSLSRAPQFPRRASGCSRSATAAPRAKARCASCLGGKGANLAEMANLGLPVPPGFTIPTSVCNYFYDNDKTYPKELKAQVEKALEYVGKLTGKTFGDAAQSAAGLGALRRARLDAGHDGYGAQSRPQRRDGRGAGAALRRQALRL